MALLTCAGAAVLEAKLSLPRVGAWRAELVLDGATAASVPGQRVELAVAGGRKWSGTIVEGGPFLDASKVRLVGGAGGLSLPATPRFFRQPFARDVLAALLRTAGETVAATADAALLATRLVRWAVVEQPIGLALASLAERLGASWRVLADGGVWLGVEAWPAQSLVGLDLLRERPEDGILEFGAEAPALLPGVDLEGHGHVGLVEHMVTPDRVRTTVWLEPADAARDRVKEELVRLVRAAFPRLAYLARYPARVVARAADGSTVDVQPDDPLMPPLSRVELRHGLPGVTAVVARGARVLVAFDAGDPGRPYVDGTWESGASVEKLVLKGSEVHVGDEVGSQPSVMGDTLSARLDAIETAYNAHKHTETGGTTAVPDTLIAAQPDVRAQKARVA